MTVSDGRETWLVGMAKAGHQRALDELMERYRPLVYHIVGHGLGDRADVDKVLRQVMEQIQLEVQNPSDPGLARGWFAVSAIRQVREVRRLRRPTPGGRSAEPDFVAIAIARLGLSGQVRQFAEATRWLAPYDWDVLALWWLTETGELTRDEFETALGLAAEEADVRQRRMRARLEAARHVVAALEADPRCADLAVLAGTAAEWPQPQRRDLLSRHIRECDRCAAHPAQLAPVEQMPARIGMVPPPARPADREAPHASAPPTDPGPPSEVAGAPDRPVVADRNGYRERRFPSAGTPMRRRTLLGLVVPGAAAVVVSLAAQSATRPPTTGPAATPAPPMALPLGRTVAPSSPRAVSVSPAPASTPPRRSRSPATSPRPAAPAPRRPFNASYEAESARLLGQAEVLAMPAASGRKIVHKLGTDNTNSWGGGYPRWGSIEFTGVAAPAAGPYAMTVFYVSGEPRRAYIQVNGGQAQALSFRSQGSWDAVYSATFAIELTAGRNSITFGNPTDWMPRLDRIRLSG